MLVVGAMVRVHRTAQCSHALLMKLGDAYAIAVFMRLHSQPPKAPEASQITSATHFMPKSRNRHILDFHYTNSATSSCRNGLCGLLTEMKPLRIVVMCSNLTSKIKSESSHLRA